MICSQSQMHPDRPLPAIGTTAAAHSGCLYNCQFRTKDPRPSCVHGQLRDWGDFLMISEGKKLLYIQNSSHVYIKTDYHIQSMTPNRQYASPASNFQPTKQFQHYKTPDP